MPIILGIESSCDDTAAAVIKGREIVASVISSQVVHEQYGGVVPELASRDHQRLIVPVVEKALAESGVEKQDLDAIAVTYGPGLAGSLLVGINFAKALSLGLDVPIVGVNHLEGHIYSVFLDQKTPSFPYLCLVVSGGHTQLVLVREGFEQEVLGSTRDDAAGEAFDKVAKLLGLGYPGGPKIDQLAKEGNAAFHAFPRSNLPAYEFSFSGLKTAVLYYLNQFDEGDRKVHVEKHLADICASFQQAVIDMLLTVLKRAVRRTGIKQVAIVGGVSANAGLRTAVEALGTAEGFDLFIPPVRFCTDNAAMIAITGSFKYQSGLTSPLTLTAIPSLKI
ncbi:MAG: tRNA (adenosine(37)-N6)-threonylcarbamoyltransferase complex transferase subunit TsaD [Rhodothermales bacterium]